MFRLVVVLKSIGESYRMRMTNEFPSTHLGNANEASDSGFQAACRHPNVSIHG